MNEERTNLFDTLNAGTFIELQPVGAFPFSEEGDSELQQSGHQDEGSEQNDFQDTGIDYVPLDHDDEDDGNWDGNGMDLNSSDDSSSDEEMPEILQQSDPEVEVTDSEPESETEEVVEGGAIGNSENVLVGKDGTLWNKNPIPRTGRTPTRNVFKIPKNHVKHSKKIDHASSAFYLVFTEKMIRTVVGMTNEEGRRRKGARWVLTDEIEIKALIGLFLHLGARKLGLQKVKKIWQGPSADNVAITAMTMSRFIDLTLALRFDDKTTRSHRRERDIFAPFREMLDEFNKNLLREYSPSINLTVDEQLVPWRGRVKFLQYLPSKPDKYGIKLFWICDSESFFPLQTIPYLGKYGERKANLGREIVKELSEHFLKSGRNITSDNFFTDLELSKWLGQRGLSLVGTVRKNKRFLPVSFQTGKDIQKFQSSFAFSTDTSIVAHKSNNKKHVVVMSTMHHNADIDPGQKRKPEMVTYYNKTKGGVDTFDYMCHSYSCKRKTRRWPLVMFYNILDASAVAAHVMYREVFPNDKGTHLDRGNFNEILGKELVMEHMMRRMACKTLNMRVKLSFNILAHEWKIESNTASSAGSEQNINRKRKTAIRGRCQQCPRKKDGKFRKTCCGCGEFVCPEHSRMICTLCK